MPLDYKEFASKIKAKYPQYKDVDDMTLAQKMVEKYPEYKDQVQFEPIKKKEPTVSPSGSDPKKSSSATQPKKASGQSGSSFKVQSEEQLGDGSTQKIIRGDAGKGERNYALRISPDGRQNWYEYSHSGNPQKGDTKDYYDKPITDPTRVSTLNRKFGFKASTDTSTDTYTGFPGKEDNEYRVSKLQNGQEVWEVRRKGQSEFTTIANAGSINALNREYNKSVSPTTDAGKKRDAQIARSKSAEEFKIITGEVMGMEEEAVVEALRRTYGDKGFTFNETGKGDAIDVIVNDGSGRRATFYLDNWSDDTDRSEALKLRKFLQENQQLGDYVDLEKEQELKTRDAYVDLTQADLKRQQDRLMSASSQAEFEKAQKDNSNEFTVKEMQKVSQDAKDLREKIVRGEYNSQQRIADITKVATTEKEKEELAAIAKANQDGFVDRYNINDNYVNDLAKTSKTVSDEFKSLNDEIEAFNSNYSNLSEEEAEAKKAEFKARYNELVQKDKDIRSEISKVDSIEAQNQKDAALYFAYNETRGSVGGGLLNSAIKGLFGVLGEENAEGLAKILGSEMTTDEFMQSDDRWDITKAAFSVAESTGALAASILTGGAAKAGQIGKFGVEVAKTLPFFSMSYNEIKSEMNTSEFKGVPDWQKEGLAILYGLGVGYLDRVSAKFGVDGVPGNIARNTIFRAISGLEKGATADAIEAAITAQFKKDISAGLIKIAGGYLVEGATEGAQSLYGSGLKAGFNWMQGKDENGKKIERFNVDNWAKDAAYEAYMGALGGLVMSVPSSTVRGIKNGFNRMSPEYVELSKKVIEDSNLRSMVITDIKTKLMTGKITKEDAQEQIQAIKDASGLFGKMPDNLSPEATAQSMDLIIERSKIEKEISGKEDNLVVAQKERIKEINTELQNISKDAVQKQTTDEGVLQPEGSEVGLQEMEQGDTKQEVVTEEGGKEAVAVESNDAKVYSTALEEAKAEMGKKGPGLDLQVSSVSEQEAQEIVDEGGKVFMTEDGLAGAYVKKDGYMGGLFKSPKSTFKDVAKVLQAARINAGGYFMDAYATKLEDIYVKNGFRPVARLKFNEEYAPEGWNAEGSPLKNKPDVVFFTYDPEGTYNVGDGQVFDDYDAAYEFTKSQKLTQQPVTQNEVTLENFAELEAQAAQNNDSERIKTLRAARMVTKALKGVKVFIHNSPEEYQQALANASGESIDTIKAEETEGRSAGQYVNGEIHIDGTIGSARTVYHEAFHDAILKSGLAVDMARGLSKIISDKNLRAQINEFVSRYENAEQNEEMIAELGSIMAEAEVELTTTKLQQFKQLINKLAQKLGLPAILPAAADRQQVVDFINSMSRGLREGREVSGYNVITTERKKSKIDVNKVRSKDRPGSRVSKGISVKTINGQKVVEETEDLSIEYVKNNAPKVFIANANIIAKYPIVSGRNKFGEINTVDKAQKVYDVFVREVADNLNYLIDEFNPEFREISTLWYDGANAIANDFAGRFNISTEQAAGIIAAMSPQKDWYQNVRLAELVLMAYDINPVMSKEMISYQVKINEIGLNDGTNSPGKKLKTAQKNYSKSKTKENKNKLDEALIKMQSAKEKADSVISMLESYVGKKLNEVPAFIQPYMVRTYHEVNTTKDYNVVMPDGNVQGVARKKDGTKASVAWGSYSEIGKAVSIRNNGSQENITASLGEMHKIRNFYNNIVDPMSIDGDVTMDTHAIAAALLMPLSGNSVQVGQNFGTGTSNSGPLGIKGLYYAYADAYALSAKEYGLLPRQVQSITWEAVRGLYTDVFKRDSSKVNGINEIWKRYQDGKISINEARNQAKEFAGGINNPTWADGLIQDESGKSSEEKSDGRRGSGDESSTVGSAKRSKQLAPKSVAVNKAKEKYDLSIERGNSTSQARESAINDLKKSDWYVNADDISREDAVRELRSKLGLKEKKAPSKEKEILFGLGRIVRSESKKDKKVIVNERTARNTQLRLEAKAARESQMDLKQKQRALIVAINQMKRGGLITVNQASALAKRLAYVNVDNPIMVERFLQYADRLFADAEYIAKIKNARELQRKIKKAIKNGSLQATTVSTAKAFSKINPSLVEDIDQYIEMADKVMNAVKPSRATEIAVELKTAMDFNKVGEYTDRAIEFENEYRKNELLSIYNDLADAGIITKDMSIDEMKEVIAGLDTDTKTKMTPEEKKEFVMNWLNETVNTYRPIIQSILKGVDPLSGESVTLTDRQQEIMREFLKLDVTQMDVRDAMAVVEAMDNFITNKVTDGLETVIARYKGAQEAKSLKDSGFTTRAMTTFGTDNAKSGFGRLWAQEMMSLKTMTDLVFRGVKSAQKITKAIGLTAYENGVALANRLWNNDIDTYYNLFGKLNPNGEKFMTAKNIYERGMYAALKRTVAGDQKAQDAELKRKIKLINDSIATLSKGGQKDREIAKVYAEVAEKLGINEEGVEMLDIDSRVDPINRDAVNWWVQKWADNYNELADVSQNVYNTILERDMFYTPDKFSSISQKEVSVEDVMEANAGAFGQFLNYEYDKKSGVLMPSAKQSSMAEGRFLDLNFDMNNSKSLKAAFVDMKTATAIRQISGFLKSKDWESVMTAKEDRDVFRKKVDNYILRSRQKSTGAIDNDYAQALDKAGRIWASMGASRALGGIFQPIKQTVPVILNTIINSGRFDFAISQDQNEWISKIGRGISNRGLESQSGFEDANKLLDNAVNSGKAVKILTAIDKANTLVLRTVLAKPDVFVARSSFISYYKQYMSQNGLSTDIDFSRPEDANQDALDYAQRMVDRQQNVSDGDLAGELIASQNPYKKLLRNTVLPFASFALNQKSRMFSDMSTLTSKEATLEDKKIAMRSLSGLGVEIAAFNSIAFGIKSLIVSIAGSIAPAAPEDEEEKEKQLWRQWGYTSARMLSDIVSPAPIMDGIVISSADAVWQQLDKQMKASSGEVDKALADHNADREANGQRAITGKEAERWKEAYLEEERFKFLQYDAAGFGGTYRITYDKLVDLSESYDLAFNGEYKDDRDQNKYILPEDRDILKSLWYGNLAYNIAGFPAEYASLNRRIENNIKKSSSISEKKYDTYNEVKAEKGRNLNKVETFLVKNMGGTKSQSGTERVLEEIDWIERNGGLQNQKQMDKYIEIFERDGSVGSTDLQKIQKLK